MTDHHYQLVRDARLYLTCAEAMASIASEMGYEPDFLDTSRLIRLAIESLTQVLDHEHK